MLPALVILGLTVVGVLVRPFGAREWVSAVAGGLAAIALSLIDPASAIASVAAQWNVFLFLVGLMTMAAIADRSGLLGELVVLAASGARGRADVLLILVSGVAVVVTLTLSNDATVLLLTPLVVGLAARLRVPLLPYAFACAYVANTASLALPIANPANVLLLRATPMTGSAFVALLGPSALLSTTAVVAVLLWRWRSELRARLSIEPADASDAGRRVVALLIAATVGAYLVALESGWPVGIVAVVGACALVVTQWVRGYGSPRDLRGDVAWGVLPLLAGLVVVVTAVEHAGLAEVLAGVLTQLPDGGLGAASAAVGSSALSNLMNNLPVALIAARGVAQTPVDQNVIGGLFVGIDVGPNFMAFGSLATLLWIVILRRRGVDMSALAYARESVAPAAAALVAALLPFALR